MQKTIIVSNRLPLKIQKKDNKIICKASEGGLATGLGSVYKTGNNLWIGWPGMYVNTEKEKDLVREELLKENLYPVFLQKQEIKDYYEGFSNETLWPTFHYFTQYTLYNSNYWNSYVKVNQKFCNEVLKHAKPGDTIWVQDYQLLLLPAMLREKLPEANIGFFLHIPFPSFEIFRLLPWREELLNGMLGADLVGFHTHDYMKHFINSANRIMGSKNIGGQLEYNGRTVIVDAFPMGIDYNKFESMAQSKAVLRNEQKLRTAFGQQKLMLAIDRLDYSKGVTERLKAFEKFLKDNPKYHEKVSLVQVLVPSRDIIQKYNSLKEEINQLTGSINSNYRTLNWTPVFHFYRSFPNEMLAALYKVADIAVVTPMRDGMNLVCKEFIACKTNKSGVLILSEMAGAAIELPDSILINPNDQRQFINAFHTGLNMTLKDQERHMEMMQSTLRKFNVQHWVKIFMERLGFAKEKQKAMSTKVLDKRTETNIINKFQDAEKRLIFLDYDGTLLPFKDEPKQAKPDKQLLDLLEDLSRNNSNRVVIVSGRDKNTLQKWLGHLNLDFIAEHGVWLKENQQEWQQIETLLDNWKMEVMPILEHYADRTPRAFIEEKDFSLVWHYRKVERELGEMRSRELINNLQYLLPSFNLQILEGDMVVEVRNADINKGRATLHWINQYPSDFIMAIGDDWTDEDIFKVMPAEAVTIKVRGILSAARFSTRSYKEVRHLLRKLLKIESLVK